MSTLGNLIDSIVSSLHSYTGVQEVSTYLTNSVTSTALSFPVGSSDQVVRGIAEVDDELVYVDIADANALTIAPYGRGYRGSTAASHSTNAQVVIDPPFPRSEVRKAIEQTILGLYPSLFQIKTADIAYQPQPVGYQLPADCDQIIDVKVKIANDPLNYWVPAPDYSFDPTSPEVSGKAINIFGWIPAGSTLRVVYAAKFGTFSTSADDISTVGLKEDWVDLIIFAVTSRMVRFLDPARLQLPAVENAARAQVVGAGDAGKVANQLYAVYQQRLAEERKKLLNLYPSRPNFRG